MRGHLGNDARQCPAHHYCQAGGGKSGATLKTAAQPGYCNLCQVTAQHSSGSTAQHSAATLLTSRTRILLATSDASRMSANSAGVTPLMRQSWRRAGGRTSTTYVPTNPLLSRPARASGVDEGQVPCNCASHRVHADLRRLGRCLAASAAPAARAPGGHCKVEQHAT